MYRIAEIGLRTLLTCYRLGINFFQTAEQVVEKGVPKPLVEKFTKLFAGK